VILLFAVAIAGVVGRAFPRWLAWPALVLAVVDLTPLGFLSARNSRSGGTPLPSLGT
jgi:hypothetical protein